MSTVSLTMIVKDELEEVQKILVEAVLYVDKTILVVSDENTAASLQAFADSKDMPHVNVQYRPWNSRFDDARNFALSLVDTDYWFWIDADDHFDFSKLPKLVALAEARGYAQLLLPYHYAHDDKGNIVATHWRERLMKTSVPFTWKGWVHETPVCDVQFFNKRVNEPVIHNPSAEHIQDSVHRNHEILVKASEESDDPRYKMYLGASYHALGEYRKAVNTLDEFIKQSNSAEHIYRAYTLMSECAYLLGKVQAALNYALQAAGLIPDYPQAYQLLAQWESDQKNWQEALEWVKVAESKPDPDMLGVYDPTSRDRTRLIAAQCEFMQQNYNAALQWLRTVSETNDMRRELEDSFVNEADAETFVTLLPKLRHFFEDDASLYNALCKDMKYDSRLRSLREAVIPAKTWAKDSVAIYCGPGFEEWGPHTLDEGMGGSEEAVVYLTRELTKLGYHVTVYGAVPDRVVDSVYEVKGSNKVVYLPHQEFNRKDTFDVFVGWRAPNFVDGIDARVKLVDVHDLLPPEQVKHFKDVIYLFKSKYHRTQYPHIPDENARIIGNGIKKEQFV